MATRPATLIVIPARFASRRFPGKPLAQLRGASGQGKPLVLRSWEAAVLAAADNDHAVVATDDDRIAKVVREAGAQCVMTPSSCRNGTERCAAVLEALPDAGRFDVVVNLQGDSPLTPARFVQALAAALRSGASDVVTPVLACDDEAIASLREDRASGRFGSTTAVTDLLGRALYFSKELLPSSRGATGARMRLHVGLYAYRPAALRTYAGWPPTPLELAEGLEQLRFLENGRNVFCIEEEAPATGFWEVNHPSDIPRVERGLREAGID